jgi:hypothetical protein
MFYKLIDKNKVNIFDVYLSHVYILGMERVDLFRPCESTKRLGQFIRYFVN